MMRSGNETFSFDDVLLIPQKSDIISRDDVDIGVSRGFLSLQVPVVSSPMDTVTEAAMAVSMARSGGMGILHRYNSIEDQSAMARHVLEQGAKAVSAAIGVSGDYLTRARALKSSGVHTFCLDVAHGHHTMMESALKSMRDAFGEQIVLIAGNVATNEGFSDLSAWGADVVRVGIGGGSICSTRIQTGHGLPTLYSVMLCAAQRELDGSDVLIMADGGIKNSGDIVKSLSFGADLVMLGSLLAGTSETPGEVITSSSGERRKVYRGMASKEAQTDWRGSARSLEGISSTVPFRGSAAEIMDELVFNIRSGLSYSGARSIREFQLKSRYVVQTSASQVESSTHILRGA